MPHSRSGLPLHVGVFGASGYAGAELLRLIAGHPSLEVKLATADSQAGGRIAELYPSLAPAYPDQVLTAADPAAADGLDLVFLALPHGASQDVVPELRKLGHRVLAPDLPGMGQSRPGSIQRGPCPQPATAIRAM